MLTKIKMEENLTAGLHPGEEVGGGGGGTWINLCWVRATGLSEPLPHIKNYKDILWPIIDPILVTFR